MKTCKNCGETKSIEDFHFDKTLKDGRKSKCKVCVIEQTTAWNRANSQKRSAAQARWRAAHPEHARTLARGQSARYRALKRNAVNEYLPVRYTSKVINFYKQCFACGSTDRLEVDHVVPLALGGAHAVRNFQVLCRQCNAEKGARNAMDYRTGPVLMWFLGGPKTIEIEQGKTTYIKLKETT